MSETEAQPKPTAKFVFITGGVVSSLGKGLASAAIGALLQRRGYQVRLRKMDPYLNVDPGTMSPFQHGEVFVTDDGAETDLDLGHYERFTGVSARRSDSVSAGQIYWNVLTRERQGEYLGATIQVIPHVTNAIKSAILRDVDDADIVLCEIGGTIGDIEGLPFSEAIRQLGNELDRGQTAFMHVTLLPFIKSAGELKTKPTQHSVRELRAIGIQPDILLCRSEHEIGDDERKKIALQCSVRDDAVIPALDCASIYEVPIKYHEAGLDNALLRALNLDDTADIDLSNWQQIVKGVQGEEGEVRVAVVGKYVVHQDAYKSLNEALTHGGIANNVRVKLDWVDSDHLMKAEGLTALSRAHAILVPGGFGERGNEGKIEAVRYARERHLPFLGICFGMQLACVEIARHVAGINGASSTEFGECSDPIVGLLTEWEHDGQIETRSDDDAKGGTMRLGAYDCDLVTGSLVQAIYRQDRIQERHRHRYEVNINYRPQLEAAGLRFSGLSPDGTLPEIVELPEHPWFIGVQFHPELKSKPFEPHPLFADFIRAARDQSRLV